MKSKRSNGQMMFDWEETRDAVSVMELPKVSRDRMISASVIPGNAKSDRRERPVRSLARSRVLDREDRSHRTDDRLEARMIGSFMIQVLTKYGISEDEFLEAYARSLESETNGCQ